MRLAITLLFLSACSAAVAQSSADDDFDILSSQYLSDLTKFSPVAATLIGDHSADDQLDHVDAAARKRTENLYLKFQAALASIDRNELSRANQVDAELLGAELRSGLWSLNTLQEWAWNPLSYVSTSGSAIYGLVARDFAPVEERLNNVTARLEQIPRFLEQARSSLVPERVPKIHAETAIQQNPGLNSIIETMVIPEIGAVSDADRVRLEAAIETAKRAIAAHQIWLEEELLPKAAGNFRIGAKLYDIKLAFALDSPLGRKYVKALAESEYETVRNDMYEISKGIYRFDHPFTTFPDTPDEAFKQVIIRAALEKAYQHLPAPDGIVDVARRPPTLSLKRTL